MCVSPVHRQRGAAEDGPVGVDQEPLDAFWGGLDETGLHVVRTRCLAIGLYTALSRADCRSCMEYCWT